MLWTAPEAGNGCIQLKAMVVERADVWYMDEGGLTYTFCEDDSPMGAAPLVEPCCACDEAKYEVIFEGKKILYRHASYIISPFSFRAVVEGAPPQGLPREQVAPALLGHHRGVPQRRVQVKMNIECILF